MNIKMFKFVKYFEAEINSIDKNSPNLYILIDYAVESFFNKVNQLPIDETAEYFNKYNDIDLTVPNSLNGYILNSLILLFFKENKEDVFVKNLLSGYVKEVPATRLILRFFAWLKQIFRLAKFPNVEIDPSLDGENKLKNSIEEVNNFIKNNRNKSFPLHKNQILCENLSFISQKVFSSLDKNLARANSKEETSESCLIANDILSSTSQSSSKVLSSYLDSNNTCFAERLPLTDPGAAKVSFASSVNPLGAAPLPPPLPPTKTNVPPPPPLPSGIIVPPTPPLPIESAVPHHPSGISTQQLKSEAESNGQTNGVGDTLLLQIRQGIKLKKSTDRELPPPSEIKNNPSSIMEAIKSTLEERAWATQLSDDSDSSSSGTDDEWSEESEDKSKIKKQTKLNRKPLLPKKPDLTMPVENTSSKISEVSGNISEPDSGHQSGSENESDRQIQALNQQASLNSPTLKVSVFFPPTSNKLEASSDLPLATSKQLP